AIGWRRHFRTCLCYGSIPRIPKARCSGSARPNCNRKAQRAADRSVAHLARHWRSRRATKLIACAKPVTPYISEEATMLAKNSKPAAVNVPNDLAAHWMPFTANRAFKKAPRLLAGAKDMHYFTVDGRKIIDAASGMWCTNAGHGRAQIAAAIA